MAETAEAVSFVFDVPEIAAPLFRYEAGKFVTVRVTIDGEVHHRSYSMSSSPAVDPELQITVKRVPGGLVSNWLIDNVVAGDALELSQPSGGFVLGEGDPEVVAF
ncbi:MAG TPA: FAD-binding oxidoreductase, partial [Acidimicrobiales bacterium]|nr:FAD-binding oxidoreductase [Acidimicrobiales bacterium]